MLLNNRCFTQKNDERIINFTFFLLCIFPIIISALLSTDGVSNTLHVFGMSVPIRGFCIFHYFTGYRCPVCGMTRCFTYLSHGNFAAAWRICPAGISVYFLCVFETVYRFARLMLRNLRSYRCLRIIEAAIVIFTCAVVVLAFVIQFF
ncbi:MAG TPA: DUF2752 domain-containing protein [Ruminiclostridium sp.]|nr:DUF2752 domain-containing protein [Ruminiclostridium sp.]